MEINEFKSLWSHYLLANNQGKDSNPETEAAFQNLHQLARASKRWWKLSLFAVGLVVIIMAVTVGLYIWKPAALSSLMNALPALLLIPIFVSVVAALYYKQSTIFDVYKYNNSVTALREVRTRFTNWYKLSVIVFSIILLPVYYFLIIGLEYKLSIHLSLLQQLILSGLLTIVTLLFNHWQYRNTYFQWLTKLKLELEHLENSNF